MSIKTLDEQLQGVFSGRIEALNAPTTEVELGEVVLGTLKNERAKTLYSLVLQSGKGLEKLLEQAQSRLANSTTDKERKEILCGLHAFKKRIQVMMGLFWEMVYDEYPAGRDSGVSIGIREGWQVVIFKSPHHGSLSDLLGGIFGGGGGPVSFGGGSDFD